MITFTMMVNNNDDDQVHNDQIKFDENQIMTITMTTPY